MRLAGPLSSSTYPSISLCLPPRLRDAYPTQLLALVYPKYRYPITQSPHQMEPDSRVLGSRIKRDDWTFEQDMVFEHAMAEFDETVR